MMILSDQGHACARLRILQGGRRAAGDKPDKSDKPHDYFLYHLSGVVVHMGTANSGHYYSFIRPRDGDGEWLEFNDTVVSTFDVKVRLRFLSNPVVSIVHVGACLALPCLALPCPALPCLALVWYEIVWYGMVSCGDYGVPVCSMLFDVVWIQNRE